MHFSPLLDSKDRREIKILLEKSAPAHRRKHHYVVLSTQTTDLAQNVPEPRVAGRVHQSVMHACPVFHSTPGMSCWRVVYTGQRATQTSGLIQHECSFVRYVLSLKIQRKRTVRLAQQQ